MKEIFNKNKRFFSMNAGDIYFVAVTFVYLIWRAKVFLARFVSQ